MRQLILLSLAILLGLPAFAAGPETPEHHEISVMRSVIMAYGMMKGQLPTSWTQIGGFYNLHGVDANLKGRQSYPIEDHYQFITQPMSLPDAEGSQVLLLRTLPLAHHDEGDKPPRFRYLVYQRNDGKIIFTSLTEQEVQSMLHKSGVTITRKAGLPAVEDDELQIK